MSIDEGHSTGAGESGAAAQRPMRLAYFTNQYPAVSHTFIRRELRAIEALGHTVLRFSVRPPARAVVDPADLEELDKTRFLLGGSKLALLMRAAGAALSRPIKVLGAARVAWSMGRRSDAGLAKHAVYLVEALALLPVLMGERVEHVHVHFGTNATAVARLVAALGGAGYSFTVHGPDEFDAVRGYDLPGKIADARFVVAISDFGRSQLQRWARAEDWAKLHVVRCTIGEDFLEEPSGACENQTPTFVSIGRLSAQKAQLVLVEAMGLLRDRGVDARLVLVGDGELRGAVERAIEQRGVGEMVELTGSVPEAEVRNRLRSATAMVLPSSAEGLPMVIMEAFGLGVPVISTWIAGIPELVIDGENGRLVPAGRADLVAGAMEELAGMSSDQRRAWGLAGQERVRQRHWTVTEARLLEGYIRRACR